jgi:hypothetical protein
MPSTYTPIATSTVSGTSTFQVTFSSVSTTYTDIVLIVSARSDFASVSDQLLFRVGNGTLDTGNNYSRTELYGDGASALSTRASNDSWIRAGFAIPGASTASGTFSTNIMNLMNYSNTSINKTFLLKGGAVSGWTTAYVNLWRNTAAINTIQIFCGNGNFVAGSTMTLYGIKAV